MSFPIRSALYLCLFALASLLVPAALAQPVDFLEAQLDDTAGIDGVAGPRFLALSPDNRHLYVASEGDSGVSVFARRRDGSLSFVQALFDDTDGIDGILGADAVAVSPDGAHVYVGSAFEAALAVFSRNRRSGRLTYLESFFDGVGGVDGLTSNVWVSVSRDGAHGYGSGFGAGAIAVFARHKASGRLTFVEAERAGGLLANAHGHVLSPNGRQLYVTSLLSDTLVVLERNRQTGALSLLETHVQGVNGVEGLVTPRGITISPNGAHVYTAGILESSIAIFERSRLNGHLTFVGAVFNGQDGVSDMERATSVTAGRSGRYLYVTSFGNSGMSVFERNPHTGGLTQVDVELDGIGGVTGMEGPLIALPTPGGKNVYVPGFFGHGVAVFERSR